MTDVKTIGIVGGGQLGRYLSAEAKKLGFRTTVLDPTENAPAKEMADKHIVGDFTDPEAVRNLSKEVDIMTFEIESAHADTLNDLHNEGLHVQPLPETLAIIRNKYQQKVFLKENDIPVGEFTDAPNKESVKKFAEKFGYPVVLKAKHGAYDGKGNATVYNHDLIDEAFEKLGNTECYIEAWVPFQKELAVVAARSLDGNIVTYPTVETIHTNHVCDTVIAPAPVDDSFRHEAESLAHRVLTIFKGAGVFGIEMFLTEDGNVLINEIAPRVHNSGHFTMDACNVSQFEQHIRAISGLPLIEPEMLKPFAIMVNILGDRLGLASPHNLDEVTQETGASIHIYGKAETKPGRKMGHFTILGDDLETLLELAEKARNKISI
jgi:5-(carboxyamino)imidazole ribonucleotide synthase